MLLCDEWIKIDRDGTCSVFLYIYETSHSTPQTLNPPTHKQSTYRRGGGGAAQGATATARCPRCCCVSGQDQGPFPHGVAPERRARLGAVLCLSVDKCVSKFDRTREVGQVHSVDPFSQPPPKETKTKPPTASSKTRRRPSPRAGCRPHHRPAQTGGGGRAWGAWHPRPRRSSTARGCPAAWRSCC